MICRRFIRPALFMLFLLGATLFAPFAQAQEAEQKTLRLRLGGSELVPTSFPFKRVSIADPDVADVVVLSPRELYVYGKKVGYTSIILWEDERGKTLLDVVVALDLTAFKEKLHELYPNEEIDVYSSEKGMVLSGTVSGPEVAEQVIRLAQNYLPKEAEGKDAAQGTGRSGAGITNLLRIGSPQQVMLEVKVAEVTRNWDREFKAGIGLEGLSDNLTGAIGTGNVFTPIEDAFIHANFPSAPEQSGIFEGAIDGLIQNPGSMFMNFAGNAANIFLQIDDFQTALRFLETNGLARTLAEPRLVTMSGQEASFLAGGEFPIPVDEGDDGISIEFKEFGVALRFTPVVFSDGRISLRVAPSVSEIASTSVIPAGILGTNFIVPNLATRKLQTTVELFDGQTLALGGLLQDNLRETIEKVPGLGEIPILGSLFRSSGYRQMKTDLLIAITPHLVKPVKEGSIKFPGEFLQPPNAYEFYLEGRLEGKRPFDEKSAFGRHDFLSEGAAAFRSGGLDGDFGYQPVNVSH
ncbi:MAG: type II and III secretion system protein family protein [Desulfuromonadales bacterium]